MKLKKLLLVIFVILFFYFIYFSFIVSHEAIHSQIFNRYGIANEINFKFFPVPKGVVTPTGDYSPCLDSCKLQHTLNDVVGYNLIILLLFITGVLFIYNVKKKIKVSTKLEGGKNEKKI